MGDFHNPIFEVFVLDFLSTLHSRSINMDVSENGIGSPKMVVSIEKIVIDLNGCETL